jgi:RND family efflux transporter MFP subunit
MNAFGCRSLQLVCGLLVCLLGSAPAEAQLTRAASMAQQRDLDGVIQPFKDSEVSSTETGIVRAILVKPGDHVVRGQPLIELDTEAVMAQWRVKKAEAEATGKLDQARAELELQETKHDKLSQMLLENKTSKLEVERARIDLLIARGRLQSELEMIRVLESDLARCQRQLDDRTIRAPIDGIVTEITKEIGEAVATNSPIVMRLVDVSRLRATFSIQEAELSTVPVGKKIHLQLGNGQIVPGSVEFVPPVADPETGWFMINVLIDNADGQILGSRCQRLTDK